MICKLIYQIFYLRLLIMFIINYNAKIFDVTLF